MSRWLGRDVRAIEKITLPLQEGVPDHGGVGSWFVARRIEIHRFLERVHGHDSALRTTKSVRRSR